MADGGTIVWRTAIGGADQARTDLKSLGPAGAAGAQQTQNAWTQAGAQVGAKIRQIAAQAATPIQQRIELAVDASGAGSAKASASVFAQAEVQAQALRRAIDPLGTATARYNAELERYRGLARAGLISTDELAKGEQQLRHRLDETTEAIRRQEKSQQQLTTGRKGLSTMQKNTLVYTASDIIGSSSTGLDPMRLLMQQGPQVLQAFIVGGEGVSTAFLAASAAAGGFLVAIGGLIALQQSAEAQQTRLVAMLNGVGAASGVTAAEVNAVARATDAATTQSIAFSREAATAFATTARVTSDNLGAATSVVDRFAIATGQKSKDALNELVAAFKNPAAGAVDLNEKLSFLSASELEHIRRMQEQGDKAGALRIVLNGLSQSLPDASKNVTGLASAWNGVTKAVSDAIEAIANFGKTPAPNVQDRLSDLMAMRRNAQDGLGVPIGGAGREASIKAAVARVDAQIAAVRAEMKANSDREARVTRSTETNQVAGAYNALNPKDAQIKAVQDRQALLRKALDGKLQSDQTPDQLRAAIADGDKQIEQIKKRGEATDKHAQALARDSAALAENAKGALDVASAYLQSNEAGLKAEAQRKAATDATRKGTDVEKRYAEQLALQVAEAAANGAKSTAGLRDQTSAQKTANDAVASGVATAVQARQAMQDEATLRPLITAQTVASGKALEVLTQAVLAYRQALEAAHAEEARSNLLAIRQDQDDTAASLRRRLANADKAPADRFDEAEIRAQSARRLQAQNIDPKSGDGLNTVNRDVANARAERDAARAEAAGDMLRDTQRENAAIVLQAELIGKSAAEQDRLRALKAAELDLADKGIAAESEKGRQILAQVDANAVLAAQVRKSAAAYDDLVSTGERFVDDVLDPQAWDDWGATGKKIINDVMAEFIRLAAVNPLKNALFGQDNPTLSSVGSALSSIFGGNSLSSAAADLAKRSTAGGAGWDAAYRASQSGIVPGFATGTDNAPGGWVDVGEHGKERVYLPPHAQVLTNAQTRAQDALPRSMPATYAGPAASGPGGGMNVQINDYRTSGARPKATQTADGVRLDLYDDVGRGMIEKSGSSGDLARNLRKTPPLRRYGN